MAPQSPPRVESLPWREIWSRDRKGVFSPLRKRWQFLTLVTPDWVIGLGWVDLGYVTQCFGGFLERGDSRSFETVMDLAPPGSLGVRVGPSPLQEAFAHYEHPFFARAFRLEASRGDLQIVGEDRRRALTLRLTLHDVDQASSLGVTGPSEHSERDIHTLKTVLLRCSGELLLGGRNARRFSLSEGRASLDFSEGFPPRHTVWQWGSALGLAEVKAASRTSASGECLLGLNLARGNNLGGQLENAVWLDSPKSFKLLPEVRFHRPTRRGKFWGVEIGPEGALQGELEFLSRGVLANRNRLGIVRSDLEQHYGDWLGWLEVEGTRYQLKNVAGILEDQDVLW
jgi:hypothetical protein